VIERSFNSFKMTELCLAFNGGKDCSALLYLLLIAQRIRARKDPDANPDLAPLKVLYVRCHSPFPEMERFIHETRRKFGLHLIVVDGPIKTGLEELKRLHPEIKAIWMGTRRGDPFTENMNHFQV
jgi:FAD synthetase